MANPCGGLTITVSSKKSLFAIDANGNNYINGEKQPKAKQCKCCGANGYTNKECEYCGQIITE